MTTLKPGADPAVVKDLMKVQYVCKLQRKGSAEHRILGFGKGFLYSERVR